MLPAITAPLIKLLVPFLQASERAKKKPKMIAPKSSIMVNVQNEPSGVADMAGSGYEVSPPATWKAEKIKQPRPAPKICATMYITPRMTEMRRVAIIPAVTIGLRCAPEIPAKAT